MSEDLPFSAEIRGGVTDEDACPYLPGRMWRNFLLDAGGEFDDRLHQFLLDRGFRRMGRYLYRPVCEDCRECRPLRIDVHRFSASKSQRRAVRRNADLDVTVEPEALYDSEKRDLLHRYLEVRHEGPMTADEGSMREFMFNSPGGTAGVSFRSGDGRLIGYGILDLTEDIVSSLYFFFDPDEGKRSLGVFSTVWEIEYARDTGRTWYHPGFYVRECAAMNYKADFGPCEILDPDVGWRPFTESDRPPASSADASTS